METHSNTLSNTPGPRMLDLKPPLSSSFRISLFLTTRRHLKIYESDVGADREAAARRRWHDNRGLWVFRGPVSSIPINFYCAPIHRFSADDPRPSSNPIRKSADTATPDTRARSGHSQGCDPRSHGRMVACQQNLQSRMPGSWEAAFPWMLIRLWKLGSRSLP